MLVADYLWRGWPAEAGLMPSPAPVASVLLFRVFEPAAPHC